MIWSALVDVIMKIRLIAGFRGVVEVAYYPTRTQALLLRLDGQTVQGEEAVDAVIEMISMRPLGAVVQVAGDQKFATMRRYRNCCIQRGLFLNLLYLYRLCTQGNCSKKRRIY